jgi:hypothetical protein
MAGTHDPWDDLTPTGLHQMRWFAMGFALMPFVVTAVAWLVTGDAKPTIEIGVSAALSGFLLAIAFELQVRGQRKRRRL